MYRVIQWATGSVGRTTLRRIIDHPDLRLVGLYAYDPAKVGKDAGEIARRDATGVRATASIDDILAIDADVVIHTPRIGVPYDAQNGDVQRLLASGKNVISVNGFYRPDAQGAAYAQPLRAAALAGRSTLAGIGMNPGFVAERVAVMFSGLMAQLERIECFETVDCSLVPAAEFLFGTLGFGTDPAAVDLAKGPLARLYTDLYRETFACVADAIGTQVGTLEEDHRLTACPRDLVLAAGTVRQGTVASTEWRWNARFADGRAMTHSVLWTVDPGLHGDRHAAHWRVRLHGRPHVSVDFRIDDPDPRAPPSRAAMDATAAVVIRAIPAVCAAPPGFFGLPAVLPFAQRL